jgi:hypothetical protein
MGKLLAETTEVFTKTITYSWKKTTRIYQPTGNLGLTVLKYLGLGIGTVIGMAIAIPVGAGLAATYAGVNTVGGGVRIAGTGATNGLITAVYNTKERVVDGWRTYRNSVSTNKARRKILAEGEKMERLALSQAATQDDAQELLLLGIETIGEKVAKYLDRLKLTDSQKKALYGRMAEDLIKSRENLDDPEKRREILKNKNISHLATVYNIEDTDIGSIAETTHTF